VFEDIFISRSTRENKNIFSPFETAGMTGRQLVI
jgi:hypothetical protein